MEPRATPAVARLHWASGRVAHCVYPAWEAEEIESVSEPASIGVAFAAQRAAVVRRFGGSATEARDVPAGSVGLCGPQPVRWVRTPSPSDTLEMTASPAVRAEIAHAMGIGTHADLDDLHGWADPVVLVAALRLRAACRGWLHVSDVARDELIRSVYAHIYRARFGGRRPAGAPLPLSPLRLRRVTDFAMAHLGQPLSLAQLADAASMSAFHFARGFKAATGVAPHRFVTALRLQHAQERLRAGADTVRAVAHDMGFENLSHFRRAFRAQFGLLPGELSR